MMSDIFSTVSLYNKVTKWKGSGKVYTVSQRKSICIYVMSNFVSLFFKFDDVFLMTNLRNTAKGVEIPTEI